MTKEQEAIETCKKKIIEPFYVFPNPTSIKLKDTDVEAVETVLSMLKEKDKEIESIRYIKNSFDYVVQKETEKQDKMIDLMAEYIIELIKFNNPNEVRELEEVKQYFEKKAEAEGE